MHHIFFCKVLSLDYKLRKQIKVNPFQSCFHINLSEMQQLKAILHSINAPLSLSNSRYAKCDAINPPLSHDLITKLERKRGL